MQNLSPARLYALIFGAVLVVAIVWPLAGAGRSPAAYRLGEAAESSFAAAAGACAAIRSRAEPSVEDATTPARRPPGVNPACGSSAPGHAGPGASAARPRPEGHSPP